MHKQRSIYKLWKNK